MKDGSIEESCRFYGADKVPQEIRELYLDLMHVWCIETCAPRYRPVWSEENKTAGQCSITSFLVQDLLGGKVYGIPLPEGGFHCYNEIGLQEVILATPDKYEVVQKSVWQFMRLRGWM